MQHYLAYAAAPSSLDALTEVRCPPNDPLCPKQCSYCGCAIAGWAVQGCMPAQGQDERLSSCSQRVLA